MMILGATMIHPTGLATAGVYGVWDDDTVPVYREVADAVHAHGTAIFGQLSHLGRQGNTFTGQRELWAPSAVPDPASRVVPHALTLREIGKVVDAHRDSAVRFMQAGFDGLEIYLAHGYLMCGFLSRFSNRREDAYGGSLENRLRLPLEAIRAVREEIGDVPIGIRVSGDEFAPDGLTLDESREIVAAILAAEEIDYVSVSHSNYTSTETMIPDMSFPRAPFTYLAKGIREVTGDVPVMTVARLVTPETCEELLTDGTADFVVLVRPLIADPEFPAKVRDGRRDEIRECVSCMVGCRGGPTRGLPIACLVNPAVGQERVAGIGRLAPRRPSPRRVVVVGGGPGGLKAAETAAIRGHEVVLLERDERLGGQLLVAAAAMPYRDELANATRFLERELDAPRRRRAPRGGGRRGARPRRSTRMSSSSRPGSTPGRPGVPGADLPHVHTAHDAILHGVEGERGRRARLGRGRLEVPDHGRVPRRRRASRADRDAGDGGRGARPLQPDPARPPAAPRRRRLPRELRAGRDRAGPRPRARDVDGGGARAAGRRGGRRLVRRRPGRALPRARRRRRARGARRRATASRRGGRSTRSGTASASAARSEHGERGR